MKKSTDIYQIKVVVNLTIDSDKLDFPTDNNGLLIWDPITCIDDYISHGLFKGHDSTYMDYIDNNETIRFEDWEVNYPPELKKKLTKIFIKNLWDHPETEGGKKLRNDFETLEKAIKEITKNLK